MIAKGVLGDAGSGLGRRCWGSRSIGWLGLIKACVMALAGWLCAASARQALELMCGLGGTTRTFWMTVDSSRRRT